MHDSNKKDAKQIKTEEACNVEKLSGKVRALVIAGIVAVVVLAAALIGSLALRVDVAEARETALAAAGGGDGGCSRAAGWCGGAFRPSARRVRRCSEQLLLPCCVRNYWYFLSTVPF